MGTAVGAVRGPARPRVSVVIPCLNEEHFIRRALDSLCAGTYPAHAMEILVVDGNSSDRTRELVQQMAWQDPRIRLLYNPRSTTPAALNIGIRAARGEIIIRADAHSSYPPRYVEALVRALDTSGAEMVGPCAVFVPSGDGAMCRAIALAVGSPFGTGARYRYHRVSGPVDAVQLGCWRRELFDRVGLFDERLLRNQDNEHSSRILRSGGRVHMTAEVCIDYYPRPTLAKMCGHAVANGQWNAFTQRMHPYTFRWRHLLPSLMFLGVALAALLVLVGAQLGSPATALLGLAIVAPYALANLAASLHTAHRGRALALAPLIAAVLASYHFSYGYGIVRGWWLVATGAWRERIGGGTKEARLS
jgi:glycosyltransferase involved in cell wall biosynthesis